MIVIKELVSVIMSTFNEEITWLEESINSILNQTYTNIEFIIILDNPKNIELKNLLKDYSEKDKRVIVIYNVENLGLVKSLNNGLAQAKGKYIARMDADDISNLNRIEQQIIYLEEHNLDFVFSSVICINEEGNEFKKTNLIPLNNRQVKKILGIGNISFHPTWLCKSDVYIKLNGYRDIDYCEDYDFSLRALDAGFKIGKMSEPTLKYRVRKNSITQSNICKQFLNARVVRDYYLKQKLNDYEEIQSTIKKKQAKLSVKYIKNYNLMDNYYNKSIESAKEKNYLYSIHYTIKAIIKNKYAVIKYNDFIKMYLLKKDKSFR